MNKPQTLEEALAIIVGYAFIVFVGLVAAIYASGMDQWSAFKLGLTILAACAVILAVILAVSRPSSSHPGTRQNGKYRGAAILIAGTTTKWPRLSIALDSSDREGHVGIFGATRSGKSTLGEALAAQDIKNGEATIILDPHATMAETLAVHSIKQGLVPCMLQADDIEMASLNLLETRPGYSAYDAARTVAEGLSNVYIPYQEELPVRIRTFLETASYLLAAADEGYTVLELPRFILQSSFREYLAKTAAILSSENGWLEPDHVLTILSWYNSLNPTQLHHQFQSSLTRLAGFLGAPDTRRLFGASVSSFSFDEVLRGTPLLIAIQRERMHHSAHLANGMVLTWITHQLRTMAPSESGFYPPTNMYLDELADISPAVFEALLLIAGKRSVRLTFLVQATIMLDPKLRKSLMSNVNTMIVLRSHGEGADELARSIFVEPTFDADAAFGGPPTSRQQQLFDLSNRIRSLPQHHFLFKSSNRPDKLIAGRSSLEYRVAPNFAKSAKAFAMEKRGRPVQDIDAEIRERTLDLDQRFGSIQDYRDERFTRELAPW